MHLFLVHRILKRVLSQTASTVTATSMQSWTVQAINHELSERSLTPGIWSFDLQYFVSREIQQCMSAQCHVGLISTKPFEVGRKVWWLIWSIHYRLSWAPNRLLVHFQSTFINLSGESSIDFAWWFLKHPYWFSKIWWHFTMSRKSERDEYELLNFSQFILQ